MAALTSGIIFCGLVPARLVSVWVNVRAMVNYTSLSQTLPHPSAFTSAITDVSRKKIAPQSDTAAVKTQPFGHHKLCETGFSVLCVCLKSAGDGCLDSVHPMDACCQFSFLYNLHMGSELQGDGLPTGESLSPSLDLSIHLVRYHSPSPSLHKAIHIASWSSFFRRFENRHEHE